MRARRKAPAQPTFTEIRPPPARFKLAEALNLAAPFRGGRFDGLLDIVADYAETSSTAIYLRTHEAGTTATTTPDFLLTADPANQRIHIMLAEDTSFFVPIEAARAYEMFGERLHTLVAAAQEQFRQGWPRSRLPYSPFTYSEMPRQNGLQLQVHRDSRIVIDTVIPLEPLDRGSTRVFELIPGKFLVIPTIGRPMSFYIKELHRATRRLEPMCQKHEHTLVHADGSTYDLPYVWPHVCVWKGGLLSTLFDLANDGGKPHLVFIRFTRTHYEILQFPFDKCPSPEPIGSPIVFNDNLFVGLHVLPSGLKLYHQYALPPDGFPDSHRKPCKHAQCNCLELKRRLHASTKTIYISNTS